MRKFARTGLPLCQSCGDESILALLSALLVSLAGLNAATYHLDSIAGDDSSDGSSPSTAWRSLEKVNATIFQPGDKLLLKSGASWTGRLHPRGSGDATNRIVLDRYGEGTLPAVHGDGIAGGAVSLENQQYWSIRNLEITNHGSKEAKKAGILVRNKSIGTLAGIEVSGCSIHDVAGEMAEYQDGKESGGIVFVITAADLSRPSRWDGVRIENNNIRNVARNGILMQSQWINKPQGPNSSWRGHGPYTVSTNIRIAGNRLEGIGGDGIIPWCVKGAMVERNFVRQSNNNSLKQGHAAVWPYFCEDVVFHTILFQNNIFVNTGAGSIAAAKGCRFERNLYFGSGQIAADSQKILADPLLGSPGGARLGIDSVAGYKLLVGSPALNMGVLIAENGGRDYWGNPVSGSTPPHLGAWNGDPIQPKREQ